MKLFKRIAVALALGSALTIGATQAQDIKIAYNADMSGTAVAELGIAARWGFEAAIEDINKNGAFDKDDKIHYYYLDLLAKEWKVQEYFPVK